MINKCLPDHVIQNYIEGLLPPAERKRVEEHLHQCPGCEKRLKQFEFVFKGLEQVDYPEPPEDFTIKTLRFIRQERTRKLRKRVYTGVVGIAAALLGILIITSTNLLMLLGIDISPVARLFIEIKHEVLMFTNYLTGILNVISVLAAGLKGGQLINSLFWGGVAAVFIIFLKLRDKLRILQHVIG